MASPGLSLSVVLGSSPKPAPSGTHLNHPPRPATNPLHSYEANRPVPCKHKGIREFPRRSAETGNRPDPPRGRRFKLCQPDRKAQVREWFSPGPRRSRSRVKGNLCDWVPLRSDVRERARQAHAATRTGARPCHRLSHGAHRHPRTHQARAARLRGSDLCREEADVDPLGRLRGSTLVARSPCWGSRVARREDHGTRGALLG